MELRERIDRILCGEGLDPTSETEAIMEAIQTEQKEKDTRINELEEALDKESMLHAKHNKRGRETITQLKDENEEYKDVLEHSRKCTLNAQGGLRECCKDRAKDANKIKSLTAELEDVKEELMSARLKNACIYGTSHPEIYKCEHEQENAELKTSIALLREALREAVKTPKIKVEAEIYLQKGNSLKGCCSIYMAHDIGYNQCLEDIRKFRSVTPKDKEK